MPNPKLYDQIDKLNDTAGLVAVCCLAVESLDLDYDEDKNGLHCLLSQIETTIREAVTAITANCD